MGKKVRRLNKRTVRILTLGVMIILTLIIALMIWATSHKDPMIYARQGDQLMKQGKYEEAARAYGRAFRYSEKDPKWLLKVAEAYYKLGEVGRALGALENAVIMDPGLIEAQARIVKIYYELYGRNAPPATMVRMEEAAQKLIDMIPSDEGKSNEELRKYLAMAYHCRGVARYARRAEDPALEKDAIEDIKRAIELFPEPEYVESLALVYIAKANQMVKLATGPEISIAAHREYLKQMYSHFDQAEKLYSSLETKGEKENYKTYILLGKFYQYYKGRTEKLLNNFCELQIRKKQSKIKLIQRRIIQTDKSPKLASNQKRRAKIALSKKMSELKLEVPEWKIESQKHQVNFTTCMEKAKKLYDLAIKYAKTPESQKETYITLADYFIQMGDANKAKEFASKAVNVAPESYGPYGKLARILQALARQEKEPKKKKELINQAISLLKKRIYELPHNFYGPQGKRNRLRRAELLITLADLYIDRREKGDAKLAENIIAELSKELGESVILYELKAKLAVLQNRLVQAIQLLEKTDQLANGQNAGIKFMLARLYLLRGEIGAAKNAIEEAIKLNPSSVDALKLAAGIYLKLRDPARALTIAEQILSDPKYENDVQVLVIKLEALVRMDLMEEADKVAKKLHAVGAKLNWEVQKSRVLIAKREYTKAEKILKEALKKNPDDKLAIIYLADVYQRQNRVQKAQELVKEAVDKHPDDEGLKKLLELISIRDPQKRAERFKEMREEMIGKTLAKALKTAQEEKDEYTRMVKLFNHYLITKDRKKAEECLRKAQKLDPKRANHIVFKYALINGKWSNAEKCIEVARRENLDGFNGLLYESQYYNTRGWDAIYKNNSQQAKEFFKKSIKPLKQIIEVFPNDSLSRALLAEAYYWTGTIDDAVVQMEKAIELNPDNPYALRAQSVILWDKLTKTPTPKPEDLLTFSRAVELAYRRLPYDPWLTDKRKWLRQQITKRAEYQLDATGDVKAALARREKRRSQHPEDIENILRIAWIYENRKEVRDVHKANKYYQEALRKAPRGDILSSYLAFARRNRLLKQAEAFLKSLAEELSQKKKADGYILLGTFYLNVGDAKQAEKSLLKAITISDNATNRLIVARFYNTVRDLEKTIEWSKKVLQSKATEKQAREARIFIIEALLALKRWKEAKVQIEEFNKVYPEEILGEIYKARLALNQENTDQAIQILTGVLEKNPDNILARELRSRAYVLNWQLKQALEDLEHIKKIAPNRLGLMNQIIMIKIYCELGRPTLAERETRTLIKQTSRDTMALETIRRELIKPLSSILTEREYDELVAWASSLNRNYWGWPYERGKFWLDKGKGEQAQKPLETAWKMVKDVPQAPVGLKNMILSSYLKSLFLSRAYSQLIKASDDALKIFKKGNRHQVLGWKAAALFAQQRYAEATKAYIEALQSVSERAPILAAQLTENVILKAISPKTLIRQLSKYSQNEGIKISIACCFFAENEVDKGIKLYNEVINNQKDNRIKSTLLILLSQELTKARRYEETVKCLREALDLEPDNIAGLNNLAYILEEYLEKPEEALPLVKKALEKFPDNPDVLDTYGQVLAKLGEKEKAILYLARSVWVRESPASRFHLGSILLDMGREAEAQIQLLRALRLVGTDKELENRIKQTLRRT